jgi:phosphoenolpyruvate carboxykinase (GTP)
LIHRFIDQIRELTTPDALHICDGSEKEFSDLASLLEKNGTFKKLPKRENSWYVTTDPSDVARVESSTFICSKSKEDAGPTNNWQDPSVMRSRLNELFKGCMKGRTMYVIPYAMGPENSSYTKYGIEITDSPYVVCSMKIMARIVPLEEDRDYVLGVHSVGYPLKEGQKDVKWPCNKEKYIVHFPEDRQIFSFGSGYGGNALLGKKCFALRIASKMGKDEGWLAEHMLIMGVTNPKGEKKYFAAAFPSACGKTNLAMMQPTLPGWKVECVGDDIAWMHFGDDGRLFAINPENGFFGVAPGTSMESNPNAIKSIKTNTIFTNVALTKDGDVWWEGLTKEPPEGLIDWKGNLFDKTKGEKAAHGNARFTVSKKQCPILDPQYDNPKGVPIEAILFGGRRSNTIPLVVEAKNWEDGVLLGASISSEMTAAQEGNLGSLRHDPFAMLPFCGYHMGDYFQHWLDMNQKGRKLPKIFSVNWFRKDQNGNFIWPGYGENSRVIEWIFNRVNETAAFQNTPMGIVPKSLNCDGLNLDKIKIEELFKVDSKLYENEMKELLNYFSIFGEKFPEALKNILKSKS